MNIHKNGHENVCLSYVFVASRMVAEFFCLFGIGCYELDWEITNIAIHICAWTMVMLLEYVICKNDVNGDCIVNVELYEQ